MRRLRAAPPRAEAAPPPAAKAGMTLIELLVAFVVFLMLVSMLVALATSGLRTWESGENRKDIYDRTHSVLRQVSSDLRSTFADPQWFVLDGTRLPHAGMYCDADSRTRVQRLRFVRAGEDRRLRPGANDPARDLGQRYYTDLWEVAYLLDPPGQPKGLYRGLRPFTRGQTSILDAQVIEAPTSPAWRDAFRLMDPGILWISWKFWTQYTTVWDEKVPLKEARRLLKQVDTKQGELVKVGPSLVWDSSRSRISSFQPFYRPLDVDDPDFVYPEIVQVLVEVEARASGTESVRLASPLEASSTSLHVSDTRQLPDADSATPRYLRIGDEWIEYRGKAGSEVAVSRRGARGTTAASHPLGSPVRFGEVFLTDVPIPAYREKVR